MNGVIWITGLAGAGKTTIATAVSARLRESGHASVLLDGDSLRSVVGEARHDRESRLAMAYRIARLAQLLAAQDLIVVAATISLFYEIHRFNRESSMSYFEVLVDCPLPTLRQRTELYDVANATDVVGVGIVAEFPTSPHFIVDNGSDALPIESHAADIIAAWNAHGRR